MYRTPDLAWPFTANVNIVVGIESDERPTRTFIADGKRTATVLRVSLGIAYIQQFLYLNRRLVRGFQLLHLSEDGVQAVEPIASLGLANAGEMPACLASEQSDSRWPRGGWTVWTADDAESVGR